MFYHHITLCKIVYHIGWAVGSFCLVVYLLVSNVLQQRQVVKVQIEPIYMGAMRDPLPASRLKCPETALKMLLLSGHQLLYIASALGR